MRAVRATTEIFSFGPTKIGMMMPASAASTGPRSDVSSQGCATTVLTGGTCLALAISRSYFELVIGTGPTADSAVISLIFSAIGLICGPFLKADVNHVQTAFTKV